MGELWEILVPTLRSNGRPYRVRYHRLWDEKVRQITGGLTILPPTLGTWTSPSDAIITERMIPVRIACTEAQIREIMTFTLRYYEQESIMAYRVSDRCLFLHKSEDTV